jgi:hypothetical protein
MIDLRAKFDKMDYGDEEYKAFCEVDNAYQYIRVYATMQRIFELKLADGSIVKVRAHSKSDLESLISAAEKELEAYQKYGLFAAWKKNSPTLSDEKILRKHNKEYRKLQEDLIQYRLDLEYAL